MTGPDDVTTPRRSPGRRGVDVPTLVTQARDGEPRAVARLISLVEDASPLLREVMAGLAPHTGHAMVVGITGSPGVGKSTSTNALVGALRARTASLAGELEFTVTGPDYRPPLPAAVEIAAYRIAVEALTNAARHSQAQRCEVIVEVSATEVRVTVSDDGIGLDPARPPHVGLWSMRERAAEVGGRCAVTSRAGGGTVVRATLPLAMDGQP